MGLRPEQLANRCVCDVLVEDTERGSSNVTRSFVVHLPPVVSSPAP